MNHTLGTRLLAVLLTLSLLVVPMPAASADGEETETLTITSVTLNHYTMDMIVDQTDTLAATVTLSNGQSYTSMQELSQVLPVEVDWSVARDRDDEVSITEQSEPLTASVRALQVAAPNEAVKAVAVTVTVTAQGAAQGQTATCQVTVKAAEPAGVTVTPETLELSPIQTSPSYTGQLKAQVTPASADPSVAWESGDRSIATVSESGLVTAVSAGRTQVTATANGYQDTCQVTVQGICLDEDQKDTLEEPLRVGDNFTLDYVIYGDSLQNKGVTWSSSDPAVVRVENGYLYAIEEGTATITVKVNGVTYSDSVAVRVEQAKADVIHASAQVGSPLDFDTLVDDLEEESSSVLRAPLSYVSGLSVDTRQGTLYYRYASEGDTGSGVGTGENYYVSPGTGQSGLEDITFVPKADFAGTATISYTSYASGGMFFPGTIEVDVELEKDVSYSTEGTKAVQLNPADFALVCRSRTGRDLNYVTFSLPDRVDGTLYYGYRSEQYPGTEVTVTGEYKYTGSPNLGDVYFVPALGSSGEVTVAYTAWDVNGTSYRGRMTIQVEEATASGDITYSTTQNGRITFDDSDFNSLSRSITGYSLDRIQLDELPRSTQGTLYYGYTSSGSSTTLVTANRNYYRSSSPYLDNITFVAEDGYVGSFSIPFTAWDVQGNRFYGQIGISVSGKSGKTLRYSTVQGGEVQMDDNDFNDLSQDLTGSNLHYVRFTLPYSSCGTLYYKYTSPDNYSSKVSENRSYYRSSSPYLEDVSFVASSSYNGTVSIPFTGWSTSGKSFSGTVEIDVNEQPDSLAYQIWAGEALTFSDSDFNRYCQSATGETLNYVRFTLPSSQQGTLYYNYKSDGNYDSKVSESRSYYRSSSPYLDKVSFVPQDGYSGTCSIRFTGWSKGGRTFSGVVTVTVKQEQVTDIVYSTAYQPVTLRASDFIRICNQRSKGELKWVKFTGADEVAGGRLYYRYGGIHSASSQVRPGTVYYPTGTPNLEDISFVPWVGYRGTTTLTYTASDSSGGTYEGTVRIQVTPNTRSNYFSDLDGVSWAAAAVDFLCENGVVSGTGNGRYSPQDPVTRGNFLVMLDRAFAFPSGTGTSFSDVPGNAYYAASIQRGYALGVVSGYPDGTFRPNEAVTREAAATMLCQAMRASGWSMSSASEQILYGYSDWKDIAPYARQSMAVLVQNGLMSGDDQGKLQPKQTLTRGEMAVILAKTLTL